MDVAALLRKISDVLTERHVGSRELGGTGQPPAKV
jgi:hypothetical protein